MKKTTLRMLKGMVLNTLATDITNYSYEKMQDFIKNTSYETIYYSVGIYGLNGACIKDKNGNLYVVTCRNTNLFMIL